MVGRVPADLYVFTEDEIAVVRACMRVAVERIGDERARRLAAAIDEAMSAGGRRPADIERSSAGMSEQDMSTGTVAALVGCSSRHVPRLVDTGRLRGMKRGREWRIDASSVQEFLESA